MKFTRTAVIAALCAAAAVAAPGLASAGPIPDGEYIGTAPSGQPYPVWDGKTITGDTTVNRLLGVDAVPGDVYRAPSIYDGSDVVHIDYARLSPAIGALVHDEVTRDGSNPNRWNGTVYFVGTGNPTPIAGFVLTK